MGDAGLPLYHVWFAKRRKWLLQDDILAAIRQELQQIALDKGIRLREHEAVVDHVHLLIETDNREGLSKAVNLLKGISARHIFQRFPEMRLDAGVRNLWQHRYGYKEIPLPAADSVAAYIRTQWDRLEKFER